MTDMDYRCVIEMRPKSPKAVYTALRSDEAYERSSATISLTGKKVFIKIRAKDITALRASVNDYLRQVRVCEAALLV